MAVNLFVIGCFLILLVQLSFGCPDLEKNEKFVMLQQEMKVR